MDRKDILVEQAGSARLLLANETLIFPLLDKKEQEAITELVVTFKSKGEVNLSHVALVCAYREMKQELHAMAKVGQRAMAELHQDEQ